MLSQPNQEEYPIGAGKEDIAIINAAIIDVIDVTG
jgi:hypothetical protein